MPSPAFTLFTTKRSAEVVKLVSIFQEKNAGVGKNTHYSILNSGLLLLVSGWEVYCEDVCQQAATKICSEQSVEFSMLHDKVKRGMLLDAGSDFKNNADPLSSMIHKLTDERWKELFANRIKESARNLNTPKFHKAKGSGLDDLFKLLIGKSISSEIGTLLKDDRFTKNLDHLVTVRGSIAHTGDPEEADKLTAPRLQAHVKTFKEAAAAIDIIIRREIQAQFGFTPWRITKSLKNEIREAARGNLD